MVDYGGIMVTYAEVWLIIVNYGQLWLIMVNYG